MDVYPELQNYIDSLQIIDTHEHLPMEAQRPKHDVLCEYLRHYFSCDLISAGLSDKGLSEARDASKDLVKRFKMIEPFWEAARSTGYGRALDLAARDLYGVEQINAGTIAKLNDAYVKAREDGGWYQTVLKKRSRIALSVLDSDLNCDRSFFASVYRFDGLIAPQHRRDLQSKGDELGVKVHTLGDWKEVFRLELDRVRKKGAVALKTGMAYLRPLRFEKVGEAEAERAFNDYFSDWNAPDWRQGIKAPLVLQDHLMHHLLKLADERGLTFQIHTGLQEGNGNVIYDANPALLTNLFLEYGDVKFDCFHMGYPYVMELSNLAKNFRNVHIDMCWGNIISPEAARRALVEWLDAVPANKISAFAAIIVLWMGSTRTRRWPARTWRLHWRKSQRRLVRSGPRQTTRAVAVLRQSTEAVRAQGAREAEKEIRGSGLRALDLGLWERACFSATVLLNTVKLGAPPASGEGRGRGFGVERGMTAGGSRRL